MKTIAALTLIICMSMSFIIGQKEKNTSSQNPTGFAVVELFTSEGCSSCPAADEAVIDIANEYKKNVFVVGFHVDYWNYLGWKDAFSNASYSKRQQQYGAVFNLNSIYTPQIVVNGKTQFVGSNRDQLHTAINQELKTNNTSSIELNAKTSDNKTVHINYKTSAGNNNILNIALVQLHTQTAVKHGENQGRQLHHINIVRDFKSIAPAKGQADITLALPDGLAAKDCMIIAYLQEKNDLHITAAAETEILQ